MRLSRVFALTKTEQRIVMLVVFLLVAIAFAKHHYEQNQFRAKPGSSPDPENQRVVHPDVPVSAADDKR